MAKPATLLIDINTLSRAADMILARKGSLTKNGILNDLARAIAGPGHDWGFLKNRPEGTYRQPSLEAPAAATSEAAPCLQSVWVVTYDDEANWAPKAPACFAKQEAALDYVARDHSWWRHKDHPFEVVMAALRDRGEYTFNELDIAEDEADDLGEVVDKYTIRVTETRVDFSTPSTTYAQPAEPETITPDWLVILNPNDPGADYMVFADQAELEQLLKRREADLLSGWSPIIKHASEVSIRATFAAQAWQRDYAVEVDAEGPTEWAIEANEIFATFLDNDYLKDSIHAPQWVKDWTGPFEIYLEFK